MLYAKLLSHSDGNVRATAQKFIDEMGGIGDVFKAYQAIWPSVPEIQKSPASFIEETSALVNGIEQENNELYKMLDERE